MDEKYGSEWSGWCSRERHGPVEYAFGSASEVVVGVFLDSLVVQTNGGGVIFAFGMIGGTGKGFLRKFT